MNTALACLLFFLLVGACLSHPVASINKHRKGWDDRLDDGDPAVRRLLKETEMQGGSGGYHDLQKDFGEPVDNEPDADFQYEQLLLHHGSCVHPVTKHPIAVGSFDFSYETCLLCQCPNGKLKCSHTC